MCRGPAFALVDGGNPEEVVAFLRENVGVGRTPTVRTAMIEEAVAHGLPIARQTFASHCEVAQRFAGWLGLSAGTQQALEFAFERWDGNGFPGAARGDEIALPARLLHVARDISVFLSAAGVTAARAVVERRSGSAYEPRLADLALRHLDEILAGLDETRIWEQALAIEPTPQIWFKGDRVDAAFAAIAAFTDLKSPWLLGYTDAAELVRQRGTPQARGALASLRRPSRACGVPRWRTSSAASV